MQAKQSKLGDEDMRVAGTAHTCKCVALLDEIHDCILYIRHVLILHAVH